MGVASHGSVSKDTQLHEAIVNEVGSIPLGNIGDLVEFGLSFDPVTSDVLASR